MLLVSSVCDPRKSFFEKGSFWITCRHSCQRDRRADCHECVWDWKRRWMPVWSNASFFSWRCELMFWYRIIPVMKLSDRLHITWNTICSLWRVLYRWTVFHPRSHCEVIYSDTEFQLFAVRHVWALLPVAIHPLFCTTSNVTTVNICIYAERRPHQELFVNACNFGSLMEFTKIALFYLLECN
jgi:hypothetical protein